VFRPVPNVDSVLLGLTRRTGTRDGEGAEGGAAGGEGDSRLEAANLAASGQVAASLAVKRLVHDAFRHRRKALAGSLALSGGAPPGIRERARAALVEMGLPADVRAERLTPAQFRELAARLAQ
jgi:16S rRNA A1518/A1519 N6-dimethyltransferase RsmA/KsgA/DIM1 with predicted DNA glycosylase/AP lyase activity